jgi:hypothetical protein
VWETTRDDGARVGGDGQPASAVRSRRSYPPPRPQRCVGGPVRGHPTGSGCGPATPDVRRRGVPRGARPPGENPPLAPRPGASASPSRRCARKRLAHVRRTVRWTPTARPTAAWECPAASRRLSCPRRTSPAATVVDRGPRSTGACASDDSTMRQDDVRPRAIGISSHQAKGGHRKEYRHVDFKSSNFGYPFMTSCTE